MRDVLDEAQILLTGRPLAEVSDADLVLTGPQHAAVIKHYGDLFKALRAMNHELANARHFFTTKKDKDRVAAVDKMMDAVNDKYKDLEKWHLVFNANL